MNTCSRDGCQQQTPNPRFCSRSCATIHINKEQPRRSKTQKEHACFNCSRVRLAKPDANIRDFCSVCSDLPEIAVAISGASKSGFTKQRLYDLGLKDAKCERCGIEEWCGLPAPLELDHIDGDRTNNWITNLAILCGNCHRQTDTWGPRNQKRRNKPT